MFPVRISVSLFVSTWRNSLDCFLIFSVVTYLSMKKLIKVLLMNFCSCIIARRLGIKQDTFSLLNQKSKNVTSWFNLYPLFYHFDKWLNEINLEVTFLLKLDFFFNLEVLFFVAVYGCWNVVKKMLPKELIFDIKIYFYSIEINLYSI